MEEWSKITVKHRILVIFLKPDLFAMYKVDHFIFFENKYVIVN